MPGTADPLCRHIEAEIDQPVDPSVQTAVAAVCRRHGAAVAAVLFYGSCLRAPAAFDDGGGVIDLYVLVDRYRDFYANLYRHRRRARTMALANALLPPNVFYIECESEAGRIRAKYAVMTLAQFGRGTSRRSFHPSLWARFCQPVRLVHARDAAARSAVVAALRAAVITLVARTAPLMDGPFTAAQLWQRAFRETYRSELRVEGTARGRTLYAWAAPRYDRLTVPALQAAGLCIVSTAHASEIRITTSAATRWRARVAWTARRWIGKPLTVARLIKGAFTFDGAVDYILWKIERHSGVRPQISAWQRRHPILASPLLVWRLYRQGALR